MPRYAWNKASTEVKRRYFELIRAGVRGAVAARIVGVSLSCGSVWFVDAGRVSFTERPIDSRYLNQDDRIAIADGLDRGDSVKTIAVAIGKSYQTVYREIARNKKPDGTYQPWYAHNQAFLRRKRPKQRRLARDEELRAIVEARLAHHWSPGQISRWLRRRYPRQPRWHICAETIYEAVYRGVLGPSSRQRLRTGRSYRHRRGRGRTRDGALKQCTTMKSIHQRPAGVESRREIGHWEGDLIVGSGQRSAIATLVERKTRLVKLVHLPRGHSATALADVLIDAFRGLPAGLCRTLTWDQGNEMFQHQRIERRTGLRIYFADPHSPWQRGTNENTNGLLRRYFPKGTDLTAHDNTKLEAVAAELNDRPRQCLHDQSPRQLLAKWERRTNSMIIRDDQ